MQIKLLVVVALLSHTAHEMQDKSSILSSLASKTGFRPNMKKKKKTQNKNKNKKEGNEAQDLQQKTPIEIDGSPLEIVKSYISG